MSRQLVLQLMLLLVGQVVGQYQPPPSCAVLPNPPPEFSYHAAARAVPNPHANTVTKRQFLRLFRDATKLASNATRLIDEAIIDEINALVPVNEFFYSLAPRHLKASMMLYEEFMKRRTPTALLSVARNVLRRKEVNKKLWFYALHQTLLARSDFTGYQIASVVDATPDRFITASVLDEATIGTRSHMGAPTTNQCVTATGEMFSRITLLPQSEGESEDIVEISAAPTTNSRPTPRCIIYNGTTGSTEAENRLWYFREDIMLNEHHWNWHQYFPFQAGRHVDRRGEMFYFMHRQVLARYNAERLSNGLGPETPLNFQLGGNIGPGYDGDIVDKQSGKFWTPRKANTPLSNIRHGSDPDFHLEMTIDKFSGIYQQFISGIDQGFLVANATIAGTHYEIPLSIRDDKGIDHIASTFDSSNRSINPDRYYKNGLHATGHLVISLSTDPDYRCGLTPGVMADPSLSIRDPSFYKHHTWVEDMFDRYKRTLDPYRLDGGDWPLRWHEAKINSLEILNAVGPTNSLKTFWSTKRFPLEQGIDGSIHNGDVNADICHQHLNHEQFQFRITVDLLTCPQNEQRQGTLRIFMAPRFHLSGRRLTMLETRKLMFQLDAFIVRLQRGRNVITRNSADSSATKPWTRSLEDRLKDPNNGGEADSCGCGWPDHLYIPKGTTQGMQFDLFAMITDYSQDRVEETYEEQLIREPCKSPYLHCGIPFRKYPDRRPMGYPFDRFPYSVSNRPLRTLEEYVSHVQNMKSVVITVQHLNEFIED